LSSAARHAVQIQSREAAARLLKQAAQFFDFHAPRTLFQKSMRSSTQGLVGVRMATASAGVLEVFDLGNGDGLAQSVCGRLEVLDSAIPVASREAAAQLQRQAARFFDKSATRQLFQKPMRYGSRQSVAVRMEIAGVLQVFDPKTGEKLAESVCGQPDQLSPLFIPALE
jgi:hypothetical protein